jgi:hypothetical protein
MAVANAPLEESALRVVVRTWAEIDELQRILGDKAGPAARRIEGDLCMVVATETPVTILILYVESLEPLGRSVDEAFAVGMQNMRESARRQISDALVTYEGGIRLLAGDTCKSSLFAFPDLWAPLAQGPGGGLLVAVPASDVVLFLKSGRPGADYALARAAQDVLDQARRPLSATVFRWEPEGWRVAVPG